MEKKEYLIGDVADMIGVSRDTLRYYEKKGILSVRKRANGYRYYSEDDIFELSSIFYQRKMNIALEKIENIWAQDCSYQIVEEITRQQILEEEAKILEHQQTLTRLQTFQEECQKISEHSGIISVRSFPDAYLIKTCSSIQESLMEWFSQSRQKVGLDMAYTYDYFLYPYENSADALTYQHSSLLFYKDLEKPLEISLDSRGYSRTIPVDCLYTIIESPVRTPDKSVVDSMIIWGKEQGLRAGSQVISDFVMQGKQDGNTTLFLEIYIPLIS